ncbi:MAG: Gfo/Idh/MocA family oxidoreductase [Verrucomicrobiae bacterium]|nr:Gfo/Idh/MocA family oxidoreductase [Verrucomicrobiae bacterium]
MKSVTRRTFLKTSAIASGSFILPRFSIGKSGQPALDKLNVALIGGGGIAKTAFGECRDQNVVAIADVDDVSGAVGFEAFPQAERYKDYRRLLDKHGKELDAVIVSTPDHSHFPATYAAIERGIAVHTQKPLTHNIWQARTLQKAYHHFGVQTVMGNQGHNFEGMKLIREWVEADLIGEIVEVHAWTNRSTPNNINARNPLPAQPIPQTLDWDLWTGPAEMAPYNEEICPKGWRWWWPYGSGGLGDIGCHTLDIPVYTLGLGYPSSVYVDNSIDFSHELLKQKPKPGAWTYVFEFPHQGKEKLKVYWYEGGHLPRIPETLKNSAKDPKDLAQGCLLVGTRNSIFSLGMRPTSPRLVENWMELRRELPPKTLPRAVGNPVKELFAAIRGDIEKCGSNFDYAVPLTELVLLGTIANRSGKTVEYLPKTMSFNDRSLNKYIKEPVRPGWEYGDGLL